MSISREAGFLVIERSRKLTRLSGYVGHYCGLCPCNALCWWWSEGGIINSEDVIDISGLSTISTGNGGFH
jgi:hypothetical protein